MKHCDKSLFLKFRGHEITYDQLIARVEELRFGTQYLVLDDLKPLLQEKYLEMPDDPLIYDRYMEQL